MKLHFYIDSDDDAERCRQSLQGRTPVVVSGLDIMTGRINPYEGVVLAVEPLSVASLGQHWRITIDTGEAPCGRPVSTRLNGRASIRPPGPAAPSR